MLIRFIWLITIYMQALIFHILVYLLVCFVWPRSAVNFITYVCMFGKEI